MSRRPYQDVWRDGKLVRKGRRDCSLRYTAIRAALDLAPGFTVLDVGGWDGYFTTRLTEDLGARCTSIDPRGIPIPGVEVITGRVAAENVHTFEADIVLALSVLHHMSDWREVLDGLLAAARYALIVEVPHPDEKDTAIPYGASLAELQATVQGLGGIPLARSPGWDASSPLLRTTWLVPRRWHMTVASGQGRAGLEFAGHLTEAHWPGFGYIPHPGTLNLRCEAVGSVRTLPGAVTWDGPEELLPHVRTFYPALLNGQPGHVRVMKSHVEAIAPVELRASLSLQDGDIVEVAGR